MICSLSLILSDFTGINVCFVVRDKKCPLLDFSGTNRGQKCAKDKHNKRKYDSQNSLFKLYISDFVLVFYNQISFNLLIVN